MEEIRLIYNKRNTMYFAYDKDEKCIAASPIKPLDTDKMEFYESVSGVRPTVRGGII